MLQFFDKFIIQPPKDGGGSGTQASITDNVTTTKEE